MTPREVRRPTEFLLLFGNDGLPSGAWVVLFGRSSAAWLRVVAIFFFFSSRRRHTRYWRDWSSDVCSSDLRLTDPFVNPVRRALAGFQISPNGAPLVTILLTILAGYFALMLAAGVLNTAAGVVLVADRRSAGAVVALFGYLLYGALTIYSLFIFIRIIMSWGRPAYHNRVMRFLVRATDPLLLPLRRMIPPLGVF